MRLDILKNNVVVPGALNVPAVAVMGTVAHTKLQGFGSGDIVTFQALIRMHVPKILDQVTDTAQDIALPIEFVLLDLE